MKKNGAVIKAGLLIVPMVFGMIGFAAVERMPLTDSVFNCVIMYVLNYGDTPPNIFVELARWTAPLATAGGVILAFTGLRDRIVQQWKYLTVDSVAVYGPEELTEPLMETLGKRGIRGGESYMPAHKYILLMEDQDNLHFYREQLRDRKVPVYMKLGAMRGYASADPNLKLFSPEEIAARLFWRKTDMFRISEACHYRPRIVLLGFDKMGEELVYWGLQSNIFHPGQRIEYHVFGDCERFLCTHPEIRELEDAVIQHTEPWYEGISLITEAELVLILPREDQISLLAQLIAAVPERSFHVFSESPQEAELFSEAGRIQVFPWCSLALTADNILEEKLFRAAMAINLRYAHIYSGVEENQENSRIEWEKLDSFLRYSNVSAADYHAIRLRMLEDMGISAGKELPADVLELLSHLEHMRWCRYHQLNGWIYGEPENGRSKDPVKRIHRDIRPYEALTEADKEKDRENIRLLMKLGETKES